MARPARACTAGRTRVTKHLGADEGTGGQTAGVHEPAAPPHRSQHPAPSPVSGDRSEEARAQSGADPGAEPQTNRLRYLDAATRQIARGMNLDETLDELCRAAVPAFADTAFVHLYAPLPIGDEIATAPGVLRLHTTARTPPRDPATHGPGPPSPTADTVQAAETARPAASGLLAKLLRDGRPVFGDTQGTDSSVAELLGTANVPRAVPPGRRLIIAPLHGRRHAMGSVVLIRGPGRADFTDDDLLVASQLATHTAIGVQKAVMYGHEASVADTLQHTMLPSSLPEPTGIQLASRYLPASKTAQVGGDWYDAIPLPGSRVALIVGDVMGHSMTSAAIMGQLRTIVQTLAGLDLPPHEVLHHLDEQAQRLGSDHIATCLYAIYDPISHRLLMANAGHPPAVLLRPNGHAEVLQVPPGAPIGVGGVVFESVEMPAPTGTTLVLYTDGLVESRDTDVGTGVEALRSHLQSTPHRHRRSSLDRLCDRILTALAPGPRDDDIALLTARFDGFPPDSVGYWHLDPHPLTAGQARRLTRRVLRRWGLDALLDTTELLVSEVVTNAVRYASRPISLRLLRTDVLRCEVTDDSPQVPRMRQAAPGDEGGRGLFLVDRLAQRWGATRLSTGKVVWFEQQIPKGQ